MENKITVRVQKGLGEIHVGTTGYSRVFPPGGPHEVTEQYASAGEIDVPELTSWADLDRDLSAWCGNHLQDSALEAVYDLEDRALAAGDRAVETWRRLQTSDHFYYMCTKWFADGDVHKYFNPYMSPYDAYVNYMNVLCDLTEELFP